MPTNNKTSHPQMELKRRITRSSSYLSNTSTKIQDPIKEKTSFHNKSLNSKSTTRTRRVAWSSVRENELSSSSEESSEEESDISLVGTKIVINYSQSSSGKDSESSDDEEDERVKKYPTRQSRNNSVVAPLKPNPTPSNETIVNNVPMRRKNRNLFTQKVSNPKGDLSESDDNEVKIPQPKKKEPNNSFLSDSIIISSDEEEYAPRYKKQKKEESEEEEEYELSEEEEEEAKTTGKTTKKEPEEEEEYEQELSEDDDDEYLEGLVEEEIVLNEESDDQEVIDSDSELSEVEFKSKKTKKKKRVPVSADQLKSSENGWSYDVVNDHYVLPVDDDIVSFVTSATIFEKLYHHQQIGLKWLAERHLDTRFRGGILSDEMGLGKTIQISALIHGLFLSEKASRVLIICPNSVIGNWQRELLAWTDNCLQGIVVFHQVGGNKSGNKKRMSLVNQFNRYANNGGAVMISTYQTISNHVDFLKEQFSDDLLLDSIVLDEAHKIKNRDAKCSMALQTLPSHSRFALTGTPIMNRLAELYALYSWIFGETLLGSEREFNESYTIPINHSTKRDATPFEKLMGNNAADSLRETIKPYMMMRTKQSVLSIDNQLYKNEDQSTTAKIGQKNDLVVWCSLTEDQINWYKDYLLSDQVKQVLNRTLNPLVGIIILKQICDHTLLCTGYDELLKQKKEELKNEMMEQDENEEKSEEDFIDDSEDNLLSEAALPSMTLDMSDLDEKRQRALQRKLRQAQEEMIKKRIREEPIENILAKSTKAQMIKQLVEKSIDDGHKVLIFSQYTRMLDIIGVILKSMNIKYNRIDGSVTKYQERLSLVDSFNQKKNIKCFLLSSQAGGVGLNLTAASRVIIVEPNFNPSIDEQAIDRAYRIGQRQNVIVYRLICSSTIEEYIYKRLVFLYDCINYSIINTNRQVSKTTVSRTAVIASNQYRYLRHSDLLEMFTLGDTTKSDTCQRFNKIHEKDRRDADGLEEHIEKFLKGLPSVVGVSDHDVLFCNEADDIQEDSHQAELVELNRRAQIERVQQIRNWSRMSSNNNTAVQNGIPSQFMFRLDDLVLPPTPQNQ
ncbi:predicted protein [Naegleria gruberi]|uniref:Predicted protein n=1 Tax=Naegleria gruberi TaxID=5762 RepID=D2VFG2_NAEGR|nr:uncharacterized protein NAEGRDRAFT_49105 [Naegleria gruberi]EFC44458.1 predicted protein [Naegleria gruberi]|eukprot:XP_002677202.1 predicted protein [Naegleria gruberi strain NEG-M]